MPVTIFGRISINFQAAVMGIMLAGFFTKSEFGLFQQLTAAVMIASALTQFGLEIIAQYSIAEDRENEDKLALQFVQLKIFSSILLIPALICYSQVLGITSELHILTLIALYVFAFFLSINRFIANGLLIYLDRIKLSMILLNTISLVKIVGVTFFYMSLKIDIYSVVSIYAITELASFSFLFFKIRKNEKVYLNFRMLKLKIKHNWKYAFLQYQDIIFSLFMSMYVGVFVLSLTHDAHLIASYTFIMSIIQATFNGASINSVLEQIMISTLLRDKFNVECKLTDSDITDRIGAWVALSIIANFSYVVFLYFCLSLLDTLWLNNRYADEVNIICVMFLALSVTAWHYHYAALSVVRKRIDLVRNSGIIGGIIHFLILLVLTPYLGLIGALLGFLVICNVRWIYLHLGLGRPSILRSGFKNLMPMSGSFSVCVAIACLTPFVDPKNNLILYLILILSLMFIVIRCAFKLRPKIGL